MAQNKCFISNQTLVDIQKHYQQIYHAESNLHVLITEKEIEVLISQLAVKLNEFYEPITSRDEPLYIVGLLTGCIQFISDISKKLTFNYSLHFLKVTSYHGEQQKGIEFTPEYLKRFLGKKNVLLMDELLDTGKSLQSVKDCVPGCKTCVLFAKMKDQTDFSGVEEIPSLWLIGYGLDDDGLRRGWPIVTYKSEIEMQTAKDFRINILQKIMQK